MIKSDHIVVPRYDAVVGVHKMELCYKVYSANSMLNFFSVQTSVSTYTNTIQTHVERYGSGVEHSRRPEPWFKSCAAMLKPWACFFILHCSSSLSCINEYLAIDSGGYVYEQPSRINCSTWLDASQRSRDGI